MQIQALSPAARQERILQLCQTTIALLEEWSSRSATAKDQNNVVSEAIGDLMNRLHT
jgi:hypothetical protein